MDIEGFLAGVKIDPEVGQLCPEYRAFVVVATGIEPRQNHPLVDSLVARAEEYARSLGEEAPISQRPHIAAWRNAYRLFGAKPQSVKNSAEQLLRRAATQMPRINPLTDLYNALSVIHEVPIGGEDLDAYRGFPRLVRALGEERFDTVADGVEVIETPEPGEVVWRDDEGVTCRRWNWRQCRRTRLSADTVNALFIIDALRPMSDHQLEVVASQLESHLVGVYPGVAVASRMVQAL